MSALVLLFLVSGATSLVYESLWARQLHLVVGTSQVAISIVLAAFMAGLAMGSLAAAHYGHLVRRPLLAFAALEGLVAVYALCFGFLIEPATWLYLTLSSALPASSTALALSQFLVLGALLLPPTVCMGATLPLLARFVSSGGADVGSHVGRLYGANTIGAVIGTGVAGFVLLPQLGLSATTWCTAAANAMVGLAAVALARRTGTLPESAGRAGRAEPADHADFHEPPEVPAQARAGGDARGDRVSVGPLLGISALAGFASLVCEVAWFRLMTLILGGSVYSFTIMLLAFLLGIGLGGWAAGGVSDRIFARSGRVGVLRVLAAMQFGVALTSWAAMFAYSELPYVFVRLFALVDGAPLPLVFMKLLIALGVMLIPALLMGASFPLLVRAAAEGDSQLSRPVGRLYGANTAGAILGASLGGLLLLPTLQMTGTILVAASANFVAAAVAMSLAAPSGRLGNRAVGLAAAACACIGFVHWQKPPWDPLLMSAGMYQYAVKLSEPTREAVRSYAVDPFEPLFYEEGLSSVVSVARSRRTGHIWLANNGKVDASTDSDMATQVFVSHLPRLLGYRSEKALVVGLASGVSAGSLLLDRGIGRLDIAELEPAVVRASHFFDHMNNRPLADPRTHMYLNDARNHLMRTPDGHYDLVVSEPSNPWISGVSNLFTREFFALGRRKLAEGGLWTQWVHIYQMAPDDLRSLLATFADVYPYVGVFRIGKSDLALVGANTPIALDVATMDAYVAQSQAIVDDLARVGFGRAEDIVSAYQFGRENLMRLVSDIELNTDDNMRIEYSAPLALHSQTIDENARMLEYAAEIPYAGVRPGRLGALARAYAERDVGWGRALATIRYARGVLPNDPALADIEGQILAASEQSLPAPDSTASAAP